jgi:hypothetical protein
MAIGFHIDLNVDRRQFCVTNPHDSFCDQMEENPVLYACCCGTESRVLVGSEATQALHENVPTNVLRLESLMFSETEL